MMKYNQSIAKILPKLWMTPFLQNGRFHRPKHTLGTRALKKIKEERKIEKNFSFFFYYFFEALVPRVAQTLACLTPPQKTSGLWKKMNSTIAKTQRFP